MSNGVFVTEAPAEKLLGDHPSVDWPITLAAGESLLRGHVLGRIASGTAAAVAGDGNTGNGVFGSVVLGAGALTGIYTVTCTAAATDAGTFAVVDPEGTAVGNMTVAVEFDSGGLTFTLADGATDFIVGDLFTITITAGVGECKGFDADSSDGTQTAKLILAEDVDATSANKNTIAYIHGGFQVRGLRWDDETNDKATGLAQLAAAGIYCK